MRRDDEIQEQELDPEATGRVTSWSTTKGGAGQVNPCISLSSPFPLQDKQQYLPPVRKDGYGH